MNRETGSRLVVIKPKNWETFQHYRDRTPPWIKLHRTLLDNADFFFLSDIAGKFLPLIWLLASEKDGALPPIEEIAFRLRLDPSQAKEIIDELINSEFLISDATYVTGTVEQVAPQAQRRAKMHGFGLRYITDEVKRAVFARDGGLCKKCASKNNIEYDHIIPVSRGGTSEISNIQLLCRACNRAKRVSLAGPVEQVATELLGRRSLETETETETETEGEKSQSDARSRDDGQKINGNGHHCPKPGTRIPPDWSLTDELRRFAVEQGLDADRTADSFRDYWIGLSGAKAIKRDWDATFRNWCRRDAERFANSNGSGRAGTHRQNSPSFAAAAFRVLARREES